MLRIGIIGATGRMGRAIVRAASERPDHAQLCIAGGIASPTSASIGQDLGTLAGLPPLGVTVTSETATLLVNSDVVVDFSRPETTQATLLACRTAHKPLVLGTTGFAAGVAQSIDDAAHHIAVLVAPNTSLGVTLLTELVRTAAKLLPEEFDIEIGEAHHRMKRDAPSGTALALGRAAAEARGQKLASVAMMNRTGNQSRRSGEIGFNVVRGGDIVGEHTVVLAGPGEQLVLQHRATDRAIFARGALHAAAWLAQKPAGKYTMQDVLGYKS